MGVSTAVCVLLLTAVFISTLADEHSLFYIYTGLNKDVALPGIDQFTALVLLDGREIDYYNSKKKKILKQSWMIEKRQEYYWEKGTQSRKSKEESVNLEILMQRMNHSDQDLHVLQWRTGCEIDESNGTVKFLRGISEYSYDGSDFLSFDIENMRWIALVPAAEGTKRKWDNLIIRNHYTKHYLEKVCVDWLTIFIEYGKETLRNHSPPVVHAFATKSVRDPKKLILTCLATGFYPKDVELSVRKFNTSLPEHLLTSSGVRPNDDGTYQLRKSVEINGDDPADYDCYVHHSSFKEPVMKKWASFQQQSSTADLQQKINWRRHEKRIQSAVKNLILDMNKSVSDVDVHVWRTDCETGNSSRLENIVSDINQCSYNGSDYLFMDDKSCITVYFKILQLDESPNWKKECEDWLQKFQEYYSNTQKEKIRDSSPEQVLLATILPGVLLVSVVIFIYIKMRVTAKYALSMKDPSYLAGDDKAQNRLTLDLSSAERRCTQSMDYLPPYLAGDDDDDDDDDDNDEGQKKLVAGLTPAAPGDEEEAQNRLISAERRCIQSMFLPPTMAGDDFGQKRLVAGLTPAAQSWNSRNVSTPNLDFGRNDE